MIDITPEDAHIENILKNKFKPQKINLADIHKLADKDFLKYWFLDGHYSSEFEAFIEILDAEILTESCDIEMLVNQYINKVFYKDEYKIWKNRLLVAAYMELNSKHIDIAKTLFSIYCDKLAYEEFLKLILRKSIYEYYFSLKYNTEENQNKFTLNQLDDIITAIEQKWISNV